MFQPPPPQPPQPQLQPPPPVPVRPPKPLRVTRIIMWIQVAASALEMIVVFLEAAIIQEHGQEMSALGWFAVIEDPVVFLLGVVAAIFVASRRPWARPLAVFVEALAIMNAILNIATAGAVTGVVAIGLAICVITLLYRPEVSLWLSQRPPASAERFGAGKS